MDIVKIVNTAINIEDVFREATVDLSSSVSLFVGRKQTFENNILWPATGVCDSQRSESLLSRVCKTVRSKKCVSKIVVYCRSLLSSDDPCVVVACSAANYQQASEAVEETVRCIALWGVDADVKSNIVESVDSYVECNNIPSDMVQVRANRGEMRSRINAFIERKREQINDENIKDFCCWKAVPEDENSCARVDAVLIHKKDSKGHLRVRRVFNSWGPQTRGNHDMSVKLPDDPSVIPPGGAYSLSATTVKCQESAVGVDERLRNLEDHMGVSKRSVPGDFYSRLKNVEDRILYLEGLSPEYTEFWGNISPAALCRTKVTKPRKHTYTKDELAKKIKELQNKLALKQM